MSPLIGRVSGYKAAMIFIHGCIFFVCRAWKYVNRIRPKHFIQRHLVAADFRHRRRKGGRVRNRAIERRNWEDEE